MPKKGFPEGDFWCAVEATRRRRRRRRWRSLGIAWRPLNFTCQLRLTFFVFATRRERCKRRRHRCVLACCDGGCASSSPHLTLPCLPFPTSRSPPHQQNNSKSLFTQSGMLLAVRQASGGLDREGTVSSRPPTILTAARSFGSDVQKMFEPARRQLSASNETTLFGERFCESGRVFVSSLPPQSSPPPSLMPPAPCRDSCLQFLVVKKGYFWRV
jgi:hypothetical protein